MDRYNRFQLISPIVGDKIYQTSSIKRGAKKCFEELKGCGKNDFNEFTIMNLDNFETYKFGINNKSSQLGGDPTKAQQASKEPAVQLEDDKIPKLEKAIVSLNDKISLLQQQIDELSSSIKKYKKEEPEEMRKDVLSEQQLKEEHLVASPKKISHGNPKLPETEGVSFKESREKEREKIIPMSRKDVYQANLNKLNKLNKADIEDF
jgi:hypothetical protein